MAQQSTAALSLRKVAKSYQQGDQTVTALIEINLDIEAGQTVALSGPSGSGKSTLLNVCGLLDRDYSGEYFLGGQDMRQEANALTSIRRDKLGFVFQHFNLVPVLSAFENVEYPLILNGVGTAERKRRVDDILEKIGLAEHANRRPDKLSGGQQQRVAIARALVRNPVLVVADEPTASLDSASANQVIDLMQDLGAEHGTTFLIATHDPRMAKRCTRIVQLRDGQILHESEALALDLDEKMPGEKS